jgi:hypothetical protein
MAMFGRSETSDTSRLAKIIMVFHTGNKQNINRLDESRFQMGEGNHKFIQTTHRHHNCKRHPNGKNSHFHNDNSDHMGMYLSMEHRNMMNLNRSTHICNSTDIAHHMHNFDCIERHHSCMHMIGNMNHCNIRPSLE